MAFDTNLLMIYAMCFLFGIGVIAWLQKGFLLEWWRVKRSQGKKLLVRVHNPMGIYYKVGQVDNGHLQFVARKRRDNKDPGRMICVTNKTPDGRTVYDAGIYRDIGVLTIDVDDLKNCVLYRDEENYKAVQGYNAELMDESLKTALRKPSEEDGWTTKDYVIVGGIALGLLVGYLIWNQGKTIDAHLKLIYDQTSTLINMTQVR